jgi:hypothetical protein
MKISLRGKSRSGLWGERVLHLTHHRDRDDLDQTARVGGEGHHLDRGGGGLGIAE